MLSKIYIGSDHAGFALKGILIPYLIEMGYEVVDSGPEHYNPSDDYPDFIIPVAKAVAANPMNAKGIVIGGSGNGEAMAANRIDGVRAAEYYGGDLEIVKLSREHNNANILSLGARFLSPNEAKEAVKLWLETKFSEEEKHARRIAEIDSLTP